VANPIDDESNKVNNDAEEEEEEKLSILTVLISGGNQNPVTIIIRKYQYGDSVAKYKIFNQNKLLYNFILITKFNKL
jgi:hypothetical protein